jgi:predicted GNAT family acetyltransferase
MAQIEVRDNPGAHRYEIFLDGELAGFAAYEPGDGQIVFTHTTIEPSAGGHGLGSELARQALDDAARRGLGVVPVCPFIAGWIGKHPDYEHLVG